MLHVAMQEAAWGSADNISGAQDACMIQYLYLENITFLLYDSKGQPKIIEEIILSYEQENRENRRNEMIETPNE